MPNPQELQELVTAVETMQHRVDLDVGRTRLPEGWVEANIADLEAAKAALRLYMTIEYTFFDDHLERGLLGVNRTLQKSDPDIRRMSKDEVNLRAAHIILDLAAEL